MKITIQGQEFDISMAELAVLYVQLEEAVKGREVEAYVARVEAYKRKYELESYGERIGHSNQEPTTFDLSEINLPDLPEIDLSHLPNK